MGVEIHANSIATHIDADGIDVKGRDGSTQHFSAKTKVWAVGVLASPLARLLAQATAQRAIGLAGSKWNRIVRCRVTPRYSSLVT